MRRITIITGLSAAAPWPQPQAHTPRVRWPRQTRDGLRSVTLHSTVSAARVLLRL